MSGWSDIVSRHRWPKEGNPISPNKTERECQNGCGIVKVTRHEFEAGREVHWTEFWRGLDRVYGTGTSTPVCELVEDAVPVL